ncbi:UNVERIFIED_CONTAM: LuxR family maltose regulon positive regulatory protein [Brevibacillus sp. OAP136]
MTPKDRAPYNSNMTIPILSTKLNIPLSRPKIVSRPRLIERLNTGFQRRLTLISASAGSGKTTLLGEWLERCERPVAWLSLDAGDNDPARFLTYLCAALQTIGRNSGEGVFALLHSPQLPPIESIVVAMLNEIDTTPNPFVLVLDDYHVLTSETIQNAIALLLDRMPSYMHLVIATREEPCLPIARLRVRDHLTEVRDTDLRFTKAEAAEFLLTVMELPLGEEDIAFLASRTEGWIAGLQAAALSFRGQKDVSSFIEKFSGTHPFVLDYLLEEVIQHLSPSTQTFLLRTSILDRLCGPLCEAVIGDPCGEYGSTTASGQDMLEALERANLFIVPLDNGRHWYRYHHLFAELLRKRLYQTKLSSDGHDEAAQCHVRASVWYEKQGLEIQAFCHAAAANDVKRAARLVEGGGMPLLFRGAVTPVLNWLEELPKQVLDARPSLWVLHASALLMSGQITRVEQKLLAAEQALHRVEQDARQRDLLGHIAAIRATIAVSKHQSETILAESKRALEYLHPDNVPVRTAAIWSLGYAHQLHGNRKEATKAYADALATSQAIGHKMITILATLGLGLMQEANNQFTLAVETYQRVIQLAGEPPLPVVCEAHLGLARIFYEWNDLESAKQHGERSVQLARGIEQSDRTVAGEVLLTRLMLAEGEVSGASAMLATGEHVARQYHFQNQMSNIADAQVMVLIRQGNRTAAAQVAQKHGRYISQARVHLADDEASEALTILEPLRMEAESKQQEDVRLTVTSLLAVALHMHGEKEKALRMLRDALTLAAPGGFVRMFVDAGAPMVRLLREAAKHAFMPDYLRKLLTACEAEDMANQLETVHDADHHLIEPLSSRELEVGSTDPHRPRTLQSGNQ